MQVRPSGSRTEEVLKTDDTDDNKSRESAGEDVDESLRLAEDLKFFLATAPVNWQENQIIRRYYLNNDQGFVSCVFWNSLYYITGTDIVKCCMYRMQKFGREVTQKKKFEEGIFSDLRNLKCGVDATLEQPKSDFLSFLFRNLCLKTQKKQKVFFWFSVPHDKLFADALERDLKRESMNQPSTTKAVAEPAISFSYDFLSSKSLQDQLMKYLEKRTAQVKQTSKMQNDSHIAHKSQSSEVQCDVDHSESKTPLRDILQKCDAYGSQLDNSTDTQQEMSSPDTSANFIPQKLVVEPSNLELDKQSEEQKDSLVVLDDADRGDFPLDYFPVEIEYPNQERDLESFNMQPAASHLPSFYDGTLSGPDEEVVPTTFAIFPQYPMTSTYGVPLSGTRSQFLMNGKYWPPQARDRSPSPIAKEFPYFKYSDQDEIDGGDFEEQESGYSDQQQVPVSQPPYMNAYPKSYNAAMYHGYCPDMTAYSSENMNYSYEDMFPSQDTYDQGYFLPQEPMNWNFVPPQAMQPPSSASGFVPRPFTPNYRSTPISARNPYISMTQGGWPQPISSPYGSKATSATTKSYPSSTFYQQHPSSFSHRRPYQASSTNAKNYVPKHPKIVKPSHRRTNSQQRQQAKKSTNMKSKGDNGEMEARRLNEQSEKRQFSIPTPESNSLAVHSTHDVEAAYHSEYYSHGGSQSQAGDMQESD